MGVVVSKPRTHCICWPVAATVAAARLKDDPVEMRMSAVTMRVKSSGSLELHTRAEALASPAMNVGNLSLS